MNKINPETANINKISSTEPDIKLKKPSQKGDTSFNDILTDQLEKSSKEHGLKESSLGEITAPFNVQHLNLEPNQTQFTQNLESALNLMETYASWLQDPDKTLKQSHGLLEQILDQTNIMEQESKDSLNLNPDLKNIFTQLTAMVNVEQVKINRGDYL